MIMTLVNHSKATPFVKNFLNPVSLWVWHAVTRQCHSECVHNIRSAFMLYGHGLLIAKIFRKFDVSTRDISLHEIRKRL